MSEQLDTFVNQRLPLPGLLAWGAALPDGSLQANGYHDGFRSAQFEEFLKKMSVLASTLVPEDSQGARFCWTFQMVRVYSICSRQGAGLMLVFRNDDRFSADSAAKVLTDFDKLTWN